MINLKNRSVFPQILNFVSKIDRFFQFLLFSSKSTRTGFRTYIDIVISVLEWVPRISPCSELLVVRPDEP
jgi:hypothetical protein